MICCKKCPYYSYGISRFGEIIPIKCEFNEKIDLESMTGRECSCVDEYESYISE